MSSYPIRMVRQFRIDVDNEIGEGGFGKAYLAYDTDLDCEVVLKEVMQGNGQALVEARNLEKVNHPNVVKVRHVVEGGEADYVVMDYVDGDPLHDVLRKHGPFVVGDWLPIMKRLIHGLSGIHSAQVVHRDIHPGNIVLKNDTPVLIDFGASSEPGMTRTPIYHPRYAAPEACRGRKSVQGDLFSLAVVTYQALFLRRGEHPDASRREFRDKMRSDLREMDTRFHSAIAAALSESVDDRPDDALSWALQMVEPCGRDRSVHESEPCGREPRRQLPPAWDSGSTETWALVRDQIAEDFGLRKDSIGFLRPKTVSRLPSKTVQHLRREWDRSQWYRRLSEPNREEWERRLRDVETGHALPIGAIYAPNGLDWDPDDHEESFEEACDLPLVGESVARYRRMIEEACGFPVRSIEFVVPEDAWTPAGKTHIGTLLYGWQELGWEVRPRVVGDELLPENVPVGHAEEIIEDRYGLPRGAIVLLSPAGSHYSGETAIGTVRREYAVPA